VADGMAGGALFVGMISGFTGVGVSANSGDAQEAQINPRRILNIRFIQRSLASASLLAMRWGLASCRRICKVVYREQDLKYTIPIDDMYKHIHTIHHIISFQMRCITHSTILFAAIGGLLSKATPH
jgi:hypothetical protein